MTRTRALAASDTVLTVDRRGADFILIGRIEPRVGGFRTELVLRDMLGRPLGQRTFDSPARSCRALDESLILALVLLVDTPDVRAKVHGSTAEELEELVPPLLVDTGLDRGPDVLRLSMPPDSQGRAAWAFELGGGGSVALGLMPGPTVGPTLFGMLRPPGFLPVVTRAAVYPFSIDRTTVPGEGISVRGFEGGAELCPLNVVRNVLEVLACGGAHLGGLHTMPLGPRSAASDLWFLVLPLRAEVRARLGAVVPYAAATARFVPSSPGFTYRIGGVEEGTAYRVPWATLELDFGVSWRVLP